MKPHAQSRVRTRLPGSTVLAPLLAALLSAGTSVQAMQDDPLAGLPPANEGAFEGGETGTLHDAGTNNVVQEDDQLSGGSFDIPTGGRPSPLFGAQPFTQRMLLFEEFGTDPIPGTFRQALTFPAPASAFRTPDSGALDAFLRQPLFPAPSLYSNDAA